MAFDKINKVSEQELTPELQEKINSKETISNVTLHRENTTVHITANERETWNSSLDNANDYTDKMIAAVLGTGVSADLNVTKLLQTKVNNTDFEQFKNTLHAVSFSGSYNDLSDKPSQVAYSQDANHAYTADLATTATSADSAKNADYATNAGNAATVGGIRITIGTTAPTDPVNNKELWFDTNSKVKDIKAYVGGTWIRTHGVWNS